MFHKLVKLVETVTRVLLQLEVLLKRWNWAYVTPKGLGRLTQVKEKVVSMVKIFVYDQALLPVTVPGVASQRFTVTIDGVDQESQSLPVEATTVTFEAPEGATVGLRLDYLDSAGNDSADFVAPDFVVVDKIPPTAPLGFGELVQVDEKEVPDEPPVE